MLPSMGILANVLEGVDTLIRRGSPFIAAGVLVGSLYWTAVTYGAITVLQVVGHNEGESWTISSRSPITKVPNFRRSCHSRAHRSHIPDGGPARHPSLSRSRPNDPMGGLDH